MSDTLNSTDARERMADVLNRVAYAKDRVRITRHGKEVAAVDGKRTVHDGPLPIDPLPFRRVAVECEDRTTDDHRAKIALQDRARVFRFVTKGQRGKRGAALLDGPDN